jgi:hypothetical protein
LAATFGYSLGRIFGRIVIVMDRAMQKHSRILATFLLLATTVGCLRMCPPPQSLVSVDWQASRCSANQVMTAFAMPSAGLQFELGRSVGNLHVCVVVEESQ